MAKPSEPSQIAPEAASQLALDFGEQADSKKISSVKGSNTRLIQFGNTIVEYSLKRGKRRTIGFVIDDRGLSVSAPKWVLIKEIEQALHEKQRWLCPKTQTNSVLKTLCKAGCKVKPGVFI